MLMESNQAQVIRQDLRNFSGAVQNMVQGVRAASISWGRSELPNVVSVDSRALHKVKACAG